MIFSGVATALYPVLIFVPYIAALIYVIREIL